MSDREYFQLLSWCWDVTAARQIAADLPVHHLDASQWFAWLGVIRLDEDHITTVDLDEPLIAVTIAGTDGAAMIIDGWHRIARAHREDLNELPVIVLDEQQERRIRIRGGD